MVGYGGSSAGSYLADPTSPIPSHCASIVVTSTVRVKEHKTSKLPPRDSHTAHIVNLEGHKQHCTVLLQILSYDPHSHTNSMVRLKHRKPLSLCPFHYHLVSEEINFDEN